MNENVLMALAGLMVEAASDALEHAFANDDLVTADAILDLLRALDALDYAYKPAQWQASMAQLS